MSGLRRVEKGYGPIRGRNVARWVALAARLQGSKDLLETAIRLAPDEPLRRGLESYDGAFYDRLALVGQLARATRTADVKQLESAIASAREEPKAPQRALRLSLGGFSRG